LAWQREDTTAAPFSQASLRLGRVFETRREDRTLAIELLSSQQGQGLQHRNAQALLMHANPTWRDLDSVILPTRGQAWLVQTAVGQARARDALGAHTQGPLIRAQARWQAFVPLAGGRQVALRLEAGQLWSRIDPLSLPEGLRWRAGGDESVRGYSYRALGPVRNGQSVGGTRWWTSSLEATQPLPPAWVGGLEGLGVATFVDAGQAALQWAEARPALGAGLGARWRSPVGLLRVDLARGQPRYGGGWRLHVSVGLAL
jgi:translocation and assembly module TamA